MPINAGEKGELVGQNVHMSGFNVRNNGVIENKLFVGDGLELGGDLVIKGKIYSVDENGKKNAYTPGSSSGGNGNGNITNINGIAAQWSELNIPASAEASSVNIDCNGGGAGVTNSFNSFDKDGDYTKTLLIHKALSAGPVVSTTGFVADNIHTCDDDDDDAEPTDRTDNNAKSYVLPNLIFTENVHCKRVYPKDYNPDMDGSKYSATQLKANEDNDFIEIKSKKVKFDDTINVINIEKDADVTKDMTITTDELKVEKKGTYIGLQYFDVKGTNDEDKVIIGKTDTTSNTVLLRVNGDISCNNLTGGVTATTSNADTFKVNYLGAYNKPNLTFITPVDGTSMEIFEGSKSYFFNENTTVDGSVVKFPLSYANAPKPDPTFKDIKYLYGPDGTNTSHTYTDKELYELQITHGAYCSNEIGYNICNLIYNRIATEDSKYTAGRSYLNAQNVNETKSIKNSDELSGTYCKLSENINILEELKKSPDMLESIMELIKEMIDDLSHLKSDSTYNSFSDDLKYKAPFNKPEDTLNKYYIELNLPVYSSSVTTDDFYVAINKTNLKTQFVRRSHHLDNNKNPYHIDTPYTMIIDTKRNILSDAEEEANTELIMQFIFFNYFMHVILYERFKNTVGEYYLSTVSYGIAKLMIGNNFITKDAWSKNATEVKVADEEGNEVVTGYKITLDSSNLAKFINWFDEEKDYEVLAWEFVRSLIMKKKINGLYVWNIPSSTSNQVVVSKYRKNGIPIWRWKIDDLDYELTADSKIDEVITLCNVEGDVIMGGELAVNNITPTDNTAVNISRLCVDELYFGNDRFNPNPSQLTTNIGYFLQATYLYPAQATDPNLDLKNVISTYDDDMGNGTDGSCPYVYIDFNNIGNLVFCGVRPIIVPGNLVGTYLIENKACFELKGASGITINPYNYDRAHNSQYGTFSDKEDLPYPFSIVSSTNSSTTTTSITIKQNKSEMYAIASTTYIIYYLKDTEIPTTSTDITKFNSSTMMQKRGYVNFSVCIDKPNLINLTFNATKPSANKIDIDYLKESGYKILYMSIDGFRITGINSNPNDTWAKSLQEDKNKIILTKK